MPHDTTRSTIRDGQGTAPRLLLTVREAAAALSVSPRMLWELTARGEIAALRIPGRGKARSIRYAVEDLQQWIQAQKEAAQRNGRPS
jgi:excisionase family DNA binding protein